MRIYADDHGEEIVDFLISHFNRTKNKAVLPGIDELCTIHIPYVEGIERKHYDLIKKVVNFYPEMQNYKAALKDFPDFEQQEAMETKRNWKVSFKHKQNIFSGQFSDPKGYTVNIENHGIGLDKFLGNDISKLEQEIGTKAFESILKKGNIIKKAKTDYISYQTPEGHYPYYWKNEDTIIVISFTELQPGRYHSDVLFVAS